MYTPETHDQMYEIMAALRTYAGTHGLPELAEMLDDSLVLLAEQGGGALARPGLPQRRQDWP